MPHVVKKQFVSRNAEWVEVPVGGGSDVLDQATADGLYVNISGDTLTGPLVLPTDPVLPLAAATKSYADTRHSPGPWVPFTLLNGWVVHADVTTARFPGYRLEPGNIVRLRGLLTLNAVLDSSNNIFATLPAEAIPATQILLGTTVHGSDAKNYSQRVSVDLNNGNLSVTSGQGIPVGLTVSYLELSGLTFELDA